MKEKKNIFYHTDCFHFSGTRPCAPFKSCMAMCSSYRVVQERVLYIHRGALGDIVRNISLLDRLIKKKINAKFFILTSSKGAQLFKETFFAESFRLQFFDIDKREEVVFRVLTFDEVYNLDKEHYSSAVATIVKSKRKYGFKLNNNGTIGVFNKKALKAYHLGLDDYQKFYINSQSIEQLMGESLEILEKDGNLLNSYQFRLSPPSIQDANKIKAKLKDSKKNKLLIGLNVGAGDWIPMKAISTRMIETSISHLISNYGKDVKILLLGGEKEKKIIDDFSIKYPQIRPYLTSNVINGAKIISICDLLITGDTLALHFALSFKIPHIVFFGPTHSKEVALTPSSHEISIKLSCSPCFSSSCNNLKKCQNNDVILKKLVDGVDLFLKGELGSRSGLRSNYTCNL